MLEFGQSGRLVRPGHADEIATELDYLMSDRQILENWRARSKRGSAYYEVERVVSDYEAVYQSLARPQGLQSRWATSSRD